MKQIIVLAKCDPCLAEEIETPGTRTVIASLGGEPKEFDVCDRHDKEIVEPFAEILRAFGVKVGKPPRKMATQPTWTPTKGTGPPVAAEGSVIEYDERGYVKCPACSHHYSRGTVVSHIERVEGVVIERPMSCPSCDASYDTPQAIAVHRGKAHGHSAIEAAVQAMHDTLEGKARQEQLAG